MVVVNHAVILLNAFLQITAHRMEYALHVIHLRNALLPITVYRMEYALHVIPLLNARLICAMMKANVLIVLLHHSARQTIVMLDLVKLVRLQMIVLINNAIKELVGHAVFQANA